MIESEGQEKFSEYRRLFISELKRLSDMTERNADEIANNKKDIAVISTKMIVYASIVSFIASVGVKFLFEKL